MFPIRTILFPTDFSPGAEAAFALAGALARDYKARLVVLHVATPPPFVTYGELDKAMQEPEGYHKMLREQLRRYQPPSPEVQLEHRLVEGDPAAETVVLAESLPADLIVMGTHGRGGLGRLLMGSVAELVLRKAPCPVLTVKMPREWRPAPETAAAAGQKA